MLTKNLAMKTLLGIKDKAKRGRDQSVRPDPAKPAPGKEQQP
jgi:hypothetical protein